MLRVFFCCGTEELRISSIKHETAGKKRQCFSNLVNKKKQHFSSNEEHLDRSNATLTHSVISDAVWTLRERAEQNKRAVQFKKLCLFCFGHCVRISIAFRERTSASDLVLFSFGPETDSTQACECKRFHQRKRKVSFTDATFAQNSCQFTLPSQL